MAEEAEAEPQRAGSPTAEAEPGAAADSASDAGAQKKEKKEKKIKKDKKDKKDKKEKQKDKKKDKKKDKDADEDEVGGKKEKTKKKKEKKKKKKKADSDSELVEEGDDDEEYADSEEDEERTKRKKPKPKTGGKRKRDESRATGEPKRPQSAYFLFSAAKRDEVRAQHPNLGLGGIAQVIGEMWKICPPEDKKQYEEQYQEDRKRYEAALAEWHQTAEGQAALQAKNAKRARPAPAPRASGGAPRAPREPGEPPVSQQVSARLRQKIVYRERPVYTPKVNPMLAELDLHSIPAGADRDYVRKWLGKLDRLRLTLDAKLSERHLRKLENGLIAFVSKRRAEGWKAKEDADEVVVVGESRADEHGRSHQPGGRVRMLPKPAERAQLLKLFPQYERADPDIQEEYLKQLRLAPETLNASPARRSPSAAPAAAEREPLRSPDAAHPAEPESEAAAEEPPKRLPSLDQLEDNNYLDQLMADEDPAAPQPVAARADSVPGADYLASLEEMGASQPDEQDDLLESLIKEIETQQLAQDADE